MPLNIAIFIFNEVEVLDFAGPFEVFNVATRVKAKLDPGCASPFNVFTVAETMLPIKARGGLPVIPHHSFQNCLPIDFIVIPGGVITEELLKPTVTRWIAETAPRAKIIAGICTGTFLLAKTGLLDGLRVTTHWEDITDLRTMFPELQVEENVRWVEQGNVITSAGISAGIDMSLHLVAKLESEKLALATARQMDYRWMQTP